MKVLWVVNIPFGPLLSLANIRYPFASGSWLGAALESFAGDSDFDIVVVTPWDIKSIKYIYDGNITYCLIPGGKPSTYKHRSTENIKIWSEIEKVFKPDIIHVWGTEYSHSYLAVSVMKSIPSVIYIQGLMESVYRYYLGGLSRSELFQAISLRDILRFDWIKAQQRKIGRRAKMEADLLRASGRFIVENTWAASHCQAIVNGGVAYRSLLPIDRVFFQESWSIDKMVPYTVMCNAAGYPLKGLHILLKAFSIVVGFYPNAKLLVPGEVYSKKTGLIQRLKETGYTRYIRSLINKLSLCDNVIFLGNLTPNQMAKNMATVNAFVMPSCMENHSSTLIEAMTVGAPCIASCVGGVQEYVEDKHNCLLYRFEEYELLASHIIKYFSNLEYINNISESAKNSMRGSRDASGFRKDMIRIYNDVLKRSS